MTAAGTHPHRHRYINQRLGAGTAVLAQVEVSDVTTFSKRPAVRARTSEQIITTAAAAAARKQQSSRVGSQAL